ncbi:efflux RND transporter periplasmic adaptor subunit [Mucilaginibacter phyllosphaerae]|uniref:Efflux RND transporter periplasmic adaptor subunit n=1 Tax=Mucilaginibacter phyllosphaerae TaxID=1812349 RepID=A0A4Y8AGX6_9SPHI|nr:efflux RND transporter periplasmic adaptor subunit [Mucilaginibacter phyllosphaerae]MBB3968900.1 HlyD family secretion protein [Mucilaginibacter phyllosphaerae]TEW67471.1 efflux RND transporter periplasmic adaptor subunit [Mucilaginibacter phyllosphaerae]GGH13218.1 RND transporter [Mucilaginibacter phyllosphaerae]
MGKTTKYILIGLGVLIVLLVIGKVTGIIGKPQLTQVAVEKAESRDINETVSASGKIKPHIEVKISPEVSGEVVELPIKEGDVVKKGQLLCRIRPDILKSGYDRAVASYNTQKASVGNSAQMLKQSEATFANQQSIYKRSKELFDKKVLTVAEFEQAKANYEGAKASLEAARQNVVGSKFGLEQSQASVKEAQDNLAKTTIYAPVDGVVSKLSIEQGERVLGTQQFAGTEIMTISDLSKMDVNVDVNENDINRIAVGNQSQIEIDAFLGKKFTGEVIEIGSSANVVGTNADQVTNFTVKVRITAQSYIDLLKKNAANHSPFRPGLTATVDIQTNHVKALSVPIQSVTTRDEKKPEAKEEQKDDKKTTIAAPSKEYVFVLQAGKVKQVEVKTGIQDDTYIQILSGLKGGEEVISAPFAAISKTLKDGMLVEKVDKSKLFNTDAKK